MHPDLEKLKELQQVDAEVRRLQEEISALPVRVAEIEAKLAGTKGQIDKAKAAIKADEVARRKLESDIQGIQQKISKYREQSLAVKTNEQYKALLAEISFAEKDITAAEDKILEGMVRSERGEAELKRLEVELKAESAAVEKEKAEARTRTAEDEKQLREWTARRDTLRSATTPEFLHHYDRVVKLRGSAIAEAFDHKCMGCNVMLRPQVYNDVRTNQMVITCDSCGRILFYDASKEPVAAAPGAPSTSENSDNAAAQ